MKKIILILFLFVSCYFIYKFTFDNKLFYLNIGDNLALGINNSGSRSEGYSLKLKNFLDNDNRLDGYNESFCNGDFRITDIIKSIKFHDKINVNNDEFTINELLKKADIITISLGMNELYYKLMLNNDNIYSYIDKMIYDMEDLFNEIHKFSNAKVFVLGYYNVTGSNYDIFTYVNYNLERIVNNHDFIFIDVDKVLDKNELFLKNNGNRYPNNDGYEKIFKIIVDKI